MSTSWTLSGEGPKVPLASQNSASGTSDEGSRRDARSHSSLQASGAPGAASVRRKQIRSSAFNAARWMRSRQRRHCVQTPESIDGWKSSSRGRRGFVTACSTKVCSSRPNIDCVSFASRTSRWRWNSRKCRIRADGSYNALPPPLERGSSSRMARQATGIALPNGLTICSSAVSASSQAALNRAFGLVGFRFLRFAGPPCVEGTGLAQIEGR